MIICEFNNRDMAKSRITQRVSSLLVCLGFIVSIVPFVASAAQNLDVATPSPSLNSQLPAGTVSNLMQEPSTPPDSWHFFVDVPPLPRETFRLKDILLTGIAAMTAVAMMPYNNVAQNGIFGEPEFPSDIRVVVQVEDEVRCKNAGLVWAIWYSIAYYFNNPQQLEEMSFSTIYRNIPSLSGGFFSKDRVVPLSLPENSSDPILISNTTTHSSSAFNSHLPGIIQSDHSAWKQIPNTSSYSVNENVTLGNLQQHHLKCGPIESGALVNPISLYTSFAAYLYHIAPRPNNQKLLDELVPGPVVRDSQAAIQAEAIKKDSRGRPMFMYEYAKAMPRLMARFMTQAPEFHEFRCDVYDLAERDLLAIFAVLKRRSASEDVSGAQVS